MSRSPSADNGVVRVQKELRNESLRLVFRNCGSARVIGAEAQVREYSLRGDGRAFRPRTLSMAGSGETMARLGRCSILIVEDEVLVALDLEMVFARAGCAVVRTAGTVEEALTAIQDAPPDVAVVDLNVAGRLSFPVLEVLANAAIPFLILSGHAPDILPPGHRRRPFMLKPYEAHGLLRRLEQILDAEAAG